MVADATDAEASVTRGLYGALCAAGFSEIDMPACSASKAGAIGSARSLPQT